MTEIKEMNNEELEYNMVKMINLRWGYDGGGMACGPVEGSTITETTWLDQNGKIFFVSVSRMSEFANVYVSDASLFDLLLYMTRDDVDMDCTISQVNGIASEVYELDLNDQSDYQDSENKEMIEITLIANDQYYHMDESASAEEWLDDYNNGRIDLSWKSEFGFDEDEEDDEIEEDWDLIPDAADLTPEELEERINELAGEVKEVSRRSYFHAEGYMSGPAASTAIIAEIVVEVSGKKVYLTGSWLDIVDEYAFCATKECLYDYYKAMDEAISKEVEQIMADEINRISCECITGYSIIFKPFFVELKKMIHEEMRNHGEEHFIEEDEEEEEFF